MKFHIPSVTLVPQTGVTNSLTLQHTRATTPTTSTMPMFPPVCVSAMPCAGTPVQLLAVACSSLAGELHIDSAFWAWSCVCCSGSYISAFVMGGTARSGAGIALLPHSPMLQTTGQALSFEDQAICGYLSHHRRACLRSFP
eukprot:375227-Amphidinium_carterae.1